MISRLCVRFLGTRPVLFHGGLVCLVWAAMACHLEPAAGQSFPAPSGGWAYTYAGAAADAQADAALDGTWNHENGSDEWDGTAPGLGSPGGASVITADGATALRVQDTGNPTSFGFSDPGSNRKLFFVRDLGPEGFSGSVLDDGVTLSFRARLATSGTLDLTYPDGGGTNDPWPAVGNGLTISNGGKGMVGIRQANGGMLSFGLALPGDTSETGPNGGLVMNQRNGSAVSGSVDNGDGGLPNFQPLDDPATFHEFWMAISGIRTDGTHRVRLWMDGDQDTKTVFDVTAGNGSEGDLGTFLSLGSPSTPEAGAFDLDFLSVASGIFFPGRDLVDGDVNGDGSVDLASDFEQIRLNFLQPVMNREQGDLNFDGLVDFGDFNLFKDVWLTMGGSLSDLTLVVPEPGLGSLLTWLLVCTPWLVAGPRRGRRSVS